MTNKITINYFSRNDFPAIGSIIKRDGKKYKVADNQVLNQTTAEEVFDDAPIPGKQYRLTGGKDNPSILNGNSWADSMVGSEADVTSKIKHRIELYLKVIDAYTLAYYERNKFTHQTPPRASVEYGTRYAKVVKVGDGVHTFIDLKNGDILKAATYKSPAKNGVRGNIFSDDVGRSVIDEHGARYLR